MKNVNSLCISCSKHISNCSLVSPKQLVNQSVTLLFLCRHCLSVTSVSDYSLTSNLLKPCVPHHCCSSLCSVTSSLSTGMFYALAGSWFQSWGMGRANQGKDLTLIQATLLCLGLLGQEMHKQLFFTPFNYNLFIYLIKIITFFFYNIYNTVQCNMYM